MTVSRMLEQFPWQTRLPDDGKQCACPEFRVIRHRDGDRAALRVLLHEDMTALLADLPEAMGFEELADILAGKYPQPTQRLSPRG